MRYQATCIAIALLAIRAFAQPVMPAAPQGVQTSRQDGFEFATVGNAGNPAWPGTWQDYLAGRGSVSYSFRISRLEITTDQWMEFANAFGPMGDPYGFRFVLASGFRQQGLHEGPGVRVEYDPLVPNPGMQPVIGITWHNAARYCNWLTNGRQVSLSALADGAYDTSTWGRDPDTNQILDAVGHQPGAKYWIPTLDEWLKATYFDPNKNGSGQPGWWQYPNRSDVALITGMPGVGQTSGGLSVNRPENLVPLLAYQNEMSPFGLFDTSGGAAELTEEPLFPGSFDWRATMGSTEKLSTAYNLDQIGSYGSGDTFAGLRIATSIPATNTLCYLISWITLGMLRRSRSTTWHHAHSFSSSQFSPFTALSCRFKHR